MRTAAPGLRIVPEELWARAHAQLEGRTAQFTGSRAYSESRYLAIRISPVRALRGRIRVAVADAREAVRPQRDLIRCAWSTMAGSCRLPEITDFRQMWLVADQSRPRRCF
jgi:hypothetical protein